MALGIWAGYGSGMHPLTAFAIAAATLLVLAVSWYFSTKSLTQRPYFAIIMSLSAFMFGLSASVIQYPPAAKSHYSRFIKDGTPLIKGVISERIKSDNYNEKYFLEVNAVGRQRATGILLLTIPKDSLTKHLHPGDALVIAGSPEPIAQPFNPYSFNYAAYMEKQGIFHQIRIKDNYIQTGVIKNFDYYIGLFRDRLIGSFTIHNFNPEVQNTFNALVFGQRQDLDKAITESYKNAGVMHILAISGLHFAVLFYVLTIVMKPFTYLGRRGRLMQFLAILALLWGFAFITGLSASVVRSVVMFTFICTGRYFNREANIYNSLAISFLVLILFKPTFLFDAGFQLSYLAVFGIVAFEPVYKKLRFSRYRAVNYATDLLTVSLAAQIAVLPLSLYYFGQLPLLFLLTNLVVIPLSNLILVTGLLTLLLNFLWAAAALVFGKLLGYGIEVMNDFIRIIASWDSFVLRDIPFTILLTIGLYGVILLLVRWLYGMTFRRSAALLAGILAFQCMAAATMHYYKNQSHFIVFHDRKNPAIAIKEPDSLTVMSKNNLVLNSNSIKTYRKAVFNPAVTHAPLENALWFKGKRILVLDADAVFPPSASPDVLILTQSPNINLERLITQLKPSCIVADGTNRPKDLSIWKATCAKEKIPFHATAEKGFYMIE